MAWDDQVNGHICQIKGKTAQRFYLVYYRKQMSQNHAASEQNM